MMSSSGNQKSNEQNQNALPRTKKSFGCFLKIAPFSFFGQPLSHTNTTDCPSFWSTLQQKNTSSYMSHFHHLSHNAAIHTTHLNKTTLDAKLKKQSKPKNAHKFHEACVTENASAKVVKMYREQELKSTASVREGMGIQRTSSAGVTSRKRSVSSSDKNALSASPKNSWILSAWNNVVHLFE